jgi:carbon storage regulator
MEDSKMLVLSRKVGERIVVGENVTIVVNKIAGGRVSIAIEAPREVSIIRGELVPFHESFRGEDKKATPPVSAPLEFDSAASFNPRNAR